VKRKTVAALLFISMTWCFAQEQKTSAAPNMQQIPTDRPYKVGGDVKAPKPIYTPDPKRPKDHPQGSVWLLCVIGADGKIHDAKVTRSLTPQADANALAVLPKWRFDPATKNGQPVTVEMSIEMGFR